jgi:two-component system response regulator
MPLSDNDLLVIELRAEAGDAVASLACLDVLSLVGELRNLRAEAAASAATHVLLVEDSESDLELSLRALRRYHLTNELHAVRDGEEALQFIFATGPYINRAVGGQLGLILLDLHLPRVDGFEVLRAVKADPRTKHIPIIVLTSSSAGPDVAESTRLGAERYMIKPVDFPKLVEAVRKLGFRWSLYDEGAAESTRSSIDAGHLSELPT